MSTSDRPRRRLAAALVAAVLAAPIAGGCTVNAGNSDRDTQRRDADRVLADGLDLDLSDPPSRSDLALPEGARTAVLQRPDREPFDVEVTFRDGHVLRTTGAVLMVTATADGPPTAVTVRRDGLTLDDLATTLRGAVDDLGAERTRADAVLAQSRRAGDGGADVVRTLPTGVAAPDRLEVESVVTAREGRVSVNYLLDWGTR